MTNLQSNTQNIKDFIQWANKTQEAREIEIRESAINGTLHYLKREIERGFSIQESGDFLLTCLNKNRRPSAYISAVRDTLEKAGWIGGVTQ